MGLRSKMPEIVITKPKIKHSNCNICLKISKKVVYKNIFLKNNKKRALILLKTRYTYNIGDN